MTSAPRPSAAPARKRRGISRRGFLIGSGLAGAGLVLAWRFGLPELQLAVANALDGAGGPPGGVAKDPSGWFEVTADNRARLFITKVEMGQGVKTALAQIAAEELGVRPADLDVVQATTRQAFVDSTGTAGSFSVSSVFDPLRQAAATLRVMLLGEAARVLNATADGLVQTGKGFALKVDPAKSVTFGQLVATRPNWQVPKDPVALKPVEAFTVIGASEPRLDIPAKVNGAAVYGYDVRVPGMLYGAVLRPPTLEARLKGARPGAAASVDGVTRVVIDGDFVGVVATSRAAAQRAVGLIEAEWDEGRRWQQEDIDAIVTVGGGGGTVVQRAGDAPASLRERTTLTAEYRTPFAIQTPLEAQSAMADVRADGATVWASTQSQFSVRGRVASAVGLKEDQVEIAPTFVGGGFGRKTGWEVAVEAARLSKAAGSPVHVAWTRAEELRHGYVRPPTHHVLAARIESGRIQAIEHQQASGDVLFAFLPSIAKNVVGGDFGAYRGAQLRYDIPHRRLVAWRRDLPVRTGPWRGLGLLANVFAVESFMDELAHAASADPLRFRLDHLGDDAYGRRMRAVLLAAAERSGWGRAATPGRALGVACSSDVDTVVAQVAEVSIERESGRVRVHRISLAMDCGLQINPDGIRAQAEGGVMWGVGSALFEEMRVKDGQVAPANFDGYRLLTMKDAPEVDVVLLDTLKDGRPRGVGEPPMGPTAAAIANAVFALTGRRLRQIPFTPERVLAALA